MLIKTSHIWYLLCLFVSVNRSVSASMTNEYLERARFLSQVINPVNLLATKKTIERAKSTPNDPQSKALLAARLHPDTGQMIPVYFSLPAIIPMNLLIVMGMLRPGQSNASIAFWQIVNQSVNTGVNWANANKSGGEQTTREVIKSYVVSVLASCGMSMAFNRIASRRQSALLKSMAPLCGVMGANVVNVAVMRGREMRDGITVNDASTGEPLGVSKKAAKQAIIHTIISRNLIAAALLALPPLTIYSINSMLPKLRLGPVVEAAVILGWMVPAVPLGVALYPQREYMLASKLEPELASKLTGTDKVSFNRGF